MHKPLSTASDVTSDPIEIDAHDAHGLEGMFYGVIDWYLITLADTENSDIENAKAKMKTEIDRLVETLGEAHWAEHNEQHDEDHDIPDDEWAKFRARCAAAKIEASDRVSDVRRAYTSLVDVQQAWVRTLRSRIAKLDLHIVDPD